jgi:hypothetical protein
MVFLMTRKVIAKAPPPDQEKINLSALWLFEVFTPGNIKNLFEGLDALNCTPQKQNKIHKFREGVLNRSGFINIERFYSELPNNIYAVDVSIFNFSPSVSILSCC